MALRLRCRLTGCSVAMPSWQKEKQVTSIHPFVLIPLAELSELPNPASINDSRLYFAAWLYNLSAATDLVNWDYELPILSKIWIDQNIGKVAELLLFLNLSNSKTLRAFPRYRIGKDCNMQSLQSWLDSCLETKQELSSVTTYGEQAERLRELNAAKDYNEPEVFRKSLRVAKTKRSYVIRSLAGKPEAQVTKCVEAVFKPQTLPVAHLKQIKAFLLENLLENSLEDHNEKQAILKNIDKTLFDKCSMYDLLGGRGFSEQTTELSAEKSVSHEGKTFTPIEFTLPDFPTEQEVEHLKPKEYLEEPQIEDFKSAALWKMVHDNWKLKTRGAN